MLVWLFHWYDRIILRHPKITILVLALLVGGMGVFAPDFRLDASADSLVLEKDRDLRYYRALRARYGSDNSLIISYSPSGELLSDSVLTDLRRLQENLLAMDRVASVTSLLNVPLIDSPRLTFDEIQQEVPSLQSAVVNRDLARRELLGSPLYRNLLMSPDGRTTALQVHFKRDETYFSLLSTRNALREKEFAQPLSATEKEELAKVTADFKEYSSQRLDLERQDIDFIRSLLANHQGDARLHLGGVPMIVADMIEYIRRDLAVFGVGVFCFLVVMLTLIFRKVRWVLIPLLCCFGSVLFMFGLLGLTGWRVTVVSSNFTSLMLIITLSLTVHLIVRYHELHEKYPKAKQRPLVFETMKSKALPSFYTAVTTIVAFGSLFLSDIRPVINFGWMMSLGIVAAFLLSYLMFPSGLLLLQPIKSRPHLDLTGVITRTFARWVEDRGRLILVVFGVLTVFSAVGISLLTVENRFMDNFKQTSEIYQGMQVLDLQLGGTTPLDVVLDAPAGFAEQAAAGNDEDDLLEEDPFAEEGDEGFTGQSYWFNAEGLRRIQLVHTYLDELPETGKVLSLATAAELMTQLNKDQPLDDLSLSVIHKKLPPDIQQSLIAPYLSADGNQIRFAVRVLESNKNLRRDLLLKQVRRHLEEGLGYAPEQVHLSGMLVLYNNVLQSLFRSQIMTLGAVFAAILIMFMILFRSIRLALIALIPTLVSALLVLGLMGWFGIPLDIMTITIAAITIGIAIDDAIHYVHRYTQEIQQDYDRLATVQRCHASVGRAMYYTSITVVIGFSILCLSNFIPTIYFGLFTGLAMVGALVANLALLPVLLMWLGPANFCWLPGYENHWSLQHLQQLFQRRQS